jgi:predicted ATPase
MLTRLEIDNFRCFEGFVWEPGQKQLILGANGCGKSSMMDALTNLRRFVAGDGKVEELFPLRERTRWLVDRAEQRFSLHAEVDKVPYCYRLVIGAAGDPIKLFIQSETLDCDNGALRVSFERGDVTLSHPVGGVSYKLNTSRSVISSLNDDESTSLAVRFADWMEKLRVFQLDPFNMGSRSEKEDWDPKVDLSNFADWYRWLHPRAAQATGALFRSLAETFYGFDALVLEDAAKGVEMLNARFRSKDGPSRDYGFEELSAGQRCLICLYTILHFVLAPGGTVLIDEPENFVSLREIQPWLTTAEEVVEDGHGQLILMSHHPEFIDQWAPPYGVKFVRDDAGPVRVRPWTGDAESKLSASELVARGWDDD